MLLAENGFSPIDRDSDWYCFRAHRGDTTPDHSGAQVPWLSLTITLVSVFLVGVVASAIAVYFALCRPLLPALKHDA